MLSMNNGPQYPAGDLIAALYILLHQMATVTAQHEDLVSALRAGRLPTQAELGVMAGHVAWSKASIGSRLNSFDPRRSGLRDGRNRTTRRFDAWPHNIPGEEML